MSLFTFLQIDCEHVVPLAPIVIPIRGLTFQPMLLILFMSGWYLLIFNVVVSCDYFVSVVSELIPKGLNVFFWQYSNFWQHSTNGFFKFFSLWKFHTTYAQGIAIRYNNFHNFWLMTTWLKSYRMICNFHYLVGNSGTFKSLS